MERTKTRAKMDHDEDAVATMLARYIPEDIGESGGPEGYIRFHGGTRQLAKARKLVAPVDYEGKSRQDLIDAVLARLRTAKEVAAGGKVWVQVMSRTDSHPIDFVAVEGEATPIRVDIEDNDEDEGNKYTKDRALADITRAAMSEWRWASTQYYQVIQESRQADIEAAAIRARLDEIIKRGHAAEVVQALKDYVPVAEKIGPELIRALERYMENRAREESGSGNLIDQPEPEPGGESERPDDEGEAVRWVFSNLENSISSVERRASELKAAAISAAMAGKLTDELKAELVERAAELRKRVEPLLEALTP